MLNRETNQMNSLKKKNILMITHSYASFQKDQIEIISKYFNHVYVLVRYKPIAEISNILAISFLKPHRKKYVFQLTDKPDNVTIIPVPLYYIPTDSTYKKLGRKHFKAVLKIIKKNDIKFDLVHSHFAWSAGYVGGKIKEKFNVPLIVTCHGYDIYDLPFRSAEWYNNIRQVLLTADSIITVSKSNLEYINSLNIKSDVSIIPN